MPWNKFLLLQLSHSSLLVLGNIVGTSFFLVYTIRRQSPQPKGELDREIACCEASHNWRSAVDKKIDDERQSLGQSVLQRRCFFAPYFQFRSKCFWQFVVVIIYCSLWSCVCSCMHTVRCRCQDQNYTTYDTSLTCVQHTLPRLRKSCRV